MPIFHFPSSIDCRSPAGFSFTGVAAFPGLFSWSFFVVSFRCLLSIPALLLSLCTARVRRGKKSNGPAKPTTPSMIVSFVLLNSVDVVLTDHRTVRGPTLKDLENRIEIRVENRTISCLSLPSAVPHSCHPDQTRPDRRPTRSHRRNPGEFCRRNTVDTGSAAAC
ncbi:hypothetical protein BDW60DRAFT_189614 [Aspergillus nidulans var. acristatus]